MGRLMVITTVDLAPGFQLAGVETFAAEDGPAAEAALRDLLRQGGASLIAVHQDFLRVMDPLLQRRIETTFPPVVLAIPGGILLQEADKRRRYISDLIQRVIGFQITFERENAK